MTKKLLITGATGFLGKQILNELEKPKYQILDIDEIFLFVRNPTKAKQLKSDKYSYTIVQGDLLDSQSIVKAVTGMDYIIHVAALYDNHSSYDRFYKANVEATQTLMNEIDPQTKVVLTSTYGVYGFTNEDFRIKEDYFDQGEPYWHYQKTKAEQEKLAHEIAEQRGIDLIAIRPPTIIGPDEYFFVPNLIENIKSKNIFLLRKRDGKKGGNIIPFAHVRDVAHAHGLALLNIEKYAGEAYHMMSFETDFKSFLDTWTDTLNVDKISTRIPYFIAFFVGWLGEFLPFLDGYSRFSVKFLASHTLLDMTKIKTDLAFNAKYNMVETIEETVSWYNQHNPDKRA